MISFAGDPQAGMIKTWRQLLDRQIRKLLSTPLEKAGEKERNDLQS